MCWNSNWKTGKQTWLWKRTVKIGMWDIQEISRPTKIKEAQETEKLNIEIAALIETKRRGMDREEIKNYIHICSGVSRKREGERDRENTIWYFCFN